MQKVDLKVEGMTCSNCALSVTKYLQKQAFSDVRVSPISGAVSFKSTGEVSMPAVEKGIASLGYKVVNETSDAMKQATHKVIRPNLLNF